jgi:hypothetical protein
MIMNQGINDYDDENNETNDNNAVTQSVIIFCYFMKNNEKSLKTMRQRFHYVMISSANDNIIGNIIRGIIVTYL